MSSHSRLDPTRGYVDALRVGMVLPDLALAGMENVAISLAHSLRERGHDVQFLLTQAPGRQFEKVRDMGFAVTVLSLTGKRAFLSSPKLNAWLEQERLDVLHTHSGDWIKVAPTAHRVRGLATVHTQHGIADSDMVSQLLRIRAARSTDFFIAVSDNVADELHADAWVPRDRIAVVPNGIDTEAYKPPTKEARAHARQLMGIARDSTIVVGMVARMDPLKNHAMLLRAFGRFRAAHPSSALVLVGDGPLLSEVCAAAEPQIAAGNIVMLGARSDVSTLLAGFDIVVLSSFTEGTSMTLLEAMACGIPCVATSVGGTPSLFGNGKYGMLVPTDDDAAMASALAKLAANEGDRRRLGEAARQHVLARYSLIELARAHEAIYRRLTRPTNRGAARPLNG